MPLYGPGYDGPQEIKYLFVDGASLHGRIENLSRQYFQNAVFEIDFRKLAQNFSKVFYYDAIKVRQDGEDSTAYEARTDTQRQRHDRANRVNGVHVFEGDARKRRRRGYEQKKVDVMIAVDMMNHTFRRNMHKATLLTGDEDFKPLVDALVREGMDLTLWYPPGETGQELLDAADSRLPLGFQSLKGLLTPETTGVFRLPSGRSTLPSDPGLGRKIREWSIVRDGVSPKHALWTDDDVYIISVEPDENTRIEFYHRDFALLKAYCSEHPLFTMPDDLAL